MKKWLLALAAIVVIGSAGYYYWYNRDEQTQTAAVTQPTAVAAKGDISVKITGSGSVNTTETVSVYAGEAGKVSKVHFKAGDKVKKGQLLIEFEKEDYTSEISRAEINLKKQDLQLENYKQQYIEASGDESKQAEIKVQMDSLRLDMDSANLELADLREQAAATPSVVSPADGTVTAANVVIGDQLNESKVVAELIDYSKLQFTMNVDELDIPKVKIGQATEITLNALPSQPLSGKVLEIAQEGTSSNGSASYAVKVTLDTIDNVIAGMSGEGSIVTASSTNTLLVPIEAVRTLGGRSFVRVPENSTDAAGQQGPGAAAGNGSANGATQQGGNANGTAPQGGSANGAAQQGGSANGATQQGGTANGAAPQGGSANGAAQQGGTANGAAQQGGTANGATQQRGDAAGNANGAAPQAGYGMRGNGQMSGQRGTGGAAGGAGQGRMVEVTIGLSNETYVEIKSGLKEGDTVLLPIPSVNTATTSSSQQQQMQMGFGQFGGGQFVVPGGGGNFGGGNFTGGNRATGGGNTGGGGVNR